MDKMVMMWKGVSVFVIVLIYIMVSDRKKEKWLKEMENRRSG